MLDFLSLITEEKGWLRNSFLPAEVEREVKGVLDQRGPTAQAFPLGSAPSITQGPGGFLCHMERLGGAGEPHWVGS